jgi:hypothetical protein
MENTRKRKYSITLELPSMPSAPLPSPTEKDEYMYETYILPEDCSQTWEKLMLQLVSDDWEVLSANDKLVKARKRRSV